MLREREKEREVLREREKEREVLRERERGGKSRVILVWYMS